MFLTHTEQDYIAQNHTLFIIVFFNLAFVDDICSLYVDETRDLCCEPSTMLW